jgi:outer membrane protein assembly factor BamB
MKKLLISTFAAAVLCCSAFGQELKPGDLIWEFETEGVVVSSPAIGRDGTVYVGSDDNNLYAINPDGTKKWEFETGGRIGQVWFSPAIGSDGTIYIGSFDNKVYAINPDGSKKWEFKTGVVLNSSSPAIGSDGTVYVGVSHANKIYALDGQTGAKKWEFETGSRTVSSPAIGSDGTVYVGSADNKVYALNPDGTKKWAFATGSHVYSSPAIGSDGTIYVGSYDNNLYAINPDGTKKWVFETGGWVQCSPAIGSNGTVYFGSLDSKVYALNGQTGFKVWEFDMQPAGLLDSSPAIGSDGTVYVGGSTDNKIYVLDGQTGAKKWEFETGGWVSKPVIGSDGKVYFGSKDKKVYALKTSSSGPADSPWPMFGQNAQRTGEQIGPPIIVTQPTEQTVTVGSTVTFNILTGGTKPLDYQWYKNGKAIEGATTSSLQLDNVTKEDETTYYVRVKNEFGVTESDPFQLIVKPRATSFIIDDVEVNETEIVATGTAKITIFSDIQSGEIFYTLDGTPPTFTSNVYLKPFELKESATIRAIAYSADFTESIEAEPVTVTIIPVFTMRVDNAGGGTVMIDPPSGPYAEGTEVTLTATPEGDWEFIEWAGDSTSSESTITITMDGPKTLKPIFGTNIAVNEIGAGKVIQMPPNPVPYGSTVTFTAKPNTGHYFFRWAGEKPGNDDSTQLQITKPNPVISGLFADISSINPGQKIWAFATGGSVHSSPAIGSDGTIYVGSDDNNLYAINPDGSKKWAFETGPVSSSPAIGSDGTIYVGSVDLDHNLYAINPDGSKKWAFNTDHYVFSSPAIGSDGTIYVGSWDYNLYAINPDSSKKWAFETGGVVDSSPAIGSDGTIYVGSSDGKLYALKTSIKGPADSPWPMFGHNAHRTGRAPAPVRDKIQIKTFSKSTTPFSLSFETESDSTYKIEVTHDLKQWGEIGEVQGTGSSVKFTDWREALFQKQYYRVKLVE